MEYPRIVLKVTNRTFKKTIALADTVVQKLTGPGPFSGVTPTPSALALMAEESREALALWGPVGNRGSHADHLSLVLKITILHNGLKAIASSCQSIAEQMYPTDYNSMASLLVTSGFELAKQRSASIKLEAVNGLYTFKSPALNRNESKIRWIRPLNTSSPKAVSNYEVRFGSTDVFSESSVIGSTTRTEYILVNRTRSLMQGFIFVTPYNSVGAGVPSDALEVVLLPA